MEVGATFPVLLLIIPISGFCGYFSVNGYFFNANVRGNPYVSNTETTFT